MADATDTEFGRRIIARIERLPDSSWQRKMRGVIGVAWFFDAFDALTIAFVLPALIGQWHIGFTDIGMLIGLGYLGQGLGSVFFGWYAQRYGRVPGAIWSCTIFSVFSLACAFSPSFYWLVGLRFLQGIGLGGEVPIMQSYLNEFSPTHRRGTFTLLTQLPFAFGIAVTSIVATWVVPHWGWQWMFVIGAVPALLTVPMRRMLPESPRWLASMGRMDEAERVMTEVEARVTANGRITLAPLPDVSHAVEAAHGTVMDLFRGIYLRRTLTIWVLWFCGYLVSYGLSAWMPSIYTKVFNLPVGQALQYGIFTSTALFIGGCFVTATVDRVGRKPWITVSLLVSGVVLIGLQGAAGMAPFSVVLVSLVPFGLIGAISLLLGPYTAENYPTHLRALGTGIGNAWLRFASFIGPFIVGWVLQAYGLGGVFVMFGCVALVGGVVAFFFATETSERLLEDLSPVVH